MNLEDDQVFQLCATIFTASYFEGQIEYPSHEAENHSFVDENISFRTEEGMEKAAGNSYNELVLECNVNTTKDDQTVFYISRGYNPNQVFAFIKDDFDDDLYLENLFADVSIVHERYNFGEVEI